MKKNKNREVYKKLQQNPFPEVEDEEDQLTEVRDYLDEDKELNRFTVNLTRDTIRNFRRMEYDGSKILMKLYNKVDNEMERKITISQINHKNMYYMYFSSYLNDILSKIEDREKNINVRNFNTYNEFIEDINSSVENIEKDNPESFLDFYIKFYLIFEGIILYTPYWSFSKSVKSKDTPNLVNLDQNIDLIRETKNDYINYYISKIGDIVEKNDFNEEKISGKIANYNREIQSILMYISKGEGVENLSLLKKHPSPDMQETMSKLYSKNEERIEEIME